MPNAACAAITVAPVWPALTSAAASPRATDSAATRIEARDFRRSAARRRFLHADDVRRIEDADARAARRRDASPARRESTSAGPGEIQTEIEMPRGGQRAVDDAAGSVVAPHRVYGDANHEVGLSVAWLSVVGLGRCRLRATTTTND